MISHGNNNSDGNNHSHGNNRSHGNNHSYGNNNSDGNNWSRGNNWSHGNNYSYGNNWSDGNNHSHGNNNSDGNNHSYGNNWSDGNNCSDGNNHSHGNNYSRFLFNCMGSHRSGFCKDQRGIAFKWFNQQLSEDDSEDFASSLNGVMQKWLPYVTDFKERNAEGWYTEYSEDNKYVSEVWTDDDDDFSTRAYHHAWSKCPYKKEIIELIKSKDYLETQSALQVFTEITGIDTNECHSNKSKTNFCPECGQKLV